MKTKKPKPTASNPKNIKRSYDKVKPPMPVVRTDNTEFKVFEPKLLNRFIVTFTSGLTDIPPYVVKSVSLPTMVRNDFNEIVGTVIGREPGNIWEDMTLTMYDPINPSTSQTIAKYLRDAIVLLNFKIELLGPVADSVSEWIITDCEVVRADFGHLDWASDNPNLVYLTVRPGNCILNY